MSRIQQARVSGGVKNFKKGFLDRWGLKEYKNSNAPTIFVGMYNDKDIAALRAHKGFKLVWLTGADKRNAAHIMDDPKTVFKVDEAWLEWMKQNTGRLPKRFKSVRLAIKDYSMFKPMPLGDKVYCYIGKGHNTGKFMDKELRQVAARSGFEFFWGVQGQTIERMIDKYYSQCFINLRLNPLAGGTTATELAYMGRRSVSNRPEGWYLNWETVDDVVRLIEEESKKIGTTPPSFIPDDYFVGREWLETEFWK